MKEGLTGPEVAMALTHAGIIDVVSERPIEVVFLLLEPAAGDARPHLQLLTTAVKIFQDMSLRRLLAQESRPDGVIDAIRSSRPSVLATQQTTLGVIPRSLRRWYSHE
jgi:hypothetical protein